MKVLVTGGAGFVGSHIVDQLIARGDQVVVVDNVSSGKKSQVNQQAVFYHVDIRSEELKEILAKERPEVVIHQAAQIHVDTSVKNPALDAEINILGSINLLEACRLAGVNKLVYASSAAVYGTPHYLPIDEKHPIAPLAGYGISKYTVEHYLSVYHQLYGLKYTILRYANVFGLRQDPRGEGGVISIFINKVLEEQPLTIFGDGEQTRDYIYVEDVARANLAAIERGDGEVLNVGTGVKTSLNEVVRQFETITGKKLEVQYGPDRAGDIKHSYFNNEKVRRVLAWEPRVSFAEGLSKTYEYYQAEYRKMDKEQ